MKKTLISALLVTVALPLAALAQTNQTTPAQPAQTEEPAMQTQEPTAPTQDPASDATAAPEQPPAEADTTTVAPVPADAAQTTDDAAQDSAQLAGEGKVEGPFVTVPQTGAWRVSDLEGKSVEDANGENIGDISDVLVNEEGEVIAVLVGVGGFLGIGEKNVAVAMSALEFGPGKTEGLPTEKEVQAEQQQAVNAPAGGTGAPTTTAPTTAAPAPAEKMPPVVGQDNLPDRIVLNVTREQLETAPAYEDVEEAGAEGGGAGGTGVVETPAVGTQPPAGAQ